MQLFYKHPYCVYWTTIALTCAFLRMIGIRPTQGFSCGCLLQMKAAETELMTESSLIRMFSGC